METNNCPNCGASLRLGFFGVNALLPENSVKIINGFTGTTGVVYCQKCGTEAISKHSKKLAEERSSLSNKLQLTIEKIPLVSIHSPLNWDYSAIEIVTGQSTTGTGIITEFTSSFTDLFGVQSGRHTNKLMEGEQLCFAQLRKNALDLGGNAVIAVDIDYAEVGGGKGMLMVCASGTAVKLHNTEILGKQRSEDLQELIEINQRINAIDLIHVPGVS